MRLYTVICTCSSCPQECHAWSLENGALAGIGITLGPAHLDPISCDTQRLTVCEKKNGGNVHVKRARTHRVRVTN